MILSQGNPDCSICGGTGQVVDWVSYGDTNVPMYSACECTFVEENEMQSDRTQADEVEHELTLGTGDKLVLTLVTEYTEHFINIGLTRDGVLEIGGITDADVEFQIRMLE